jgi:cyclic lactone autoinducer peptide
MNTKSKQLLSVLASGLVLLTSFEINAASWLFIHQPKVPTQRKK